MAVGAVRDNRRTPNLYGKREGFPEDRKSRRDRRPGRLYEVPQQTPPDLVFELDKTPGEIHAGSEPTHYLTEAERVALERVAWRLLRVHRPEADLERTFRDLVEKWREDTLYMSSVPRMATHPAYQRIIGMGPAVLPLLLRELERTRDHWLWALNAITGEDPAPEGANFDEAVDAWLDWGEERGYL